MGKQYAVMIKAHEAAVEPHILSERLAPLLGASLEEVEDALLSSPIILQKALSYGEALEFQRELSRRRIPSVVSKEIGEGREFLLPEQVQKMGEEVEGGEGGSALGEEVEEDLDLDFLDEVSEATSGSNPSGGQEDAGAWADLFPDLADNREVGTAGGSEEASVGVAEAESSGRVHSVDESGAALNEERGNNGRTSGWSGQNGDAPDIADAVDEVDLFLEDYAPEDSLGSSEVFPGPSGSGDKAVDSRHRAGNFDGARLRDAFVGADGERPPYQPKGFDRRPEHVPLLAALLAVLAPGAGHIFNGQDARGRGLAMKGLLLWPWVKSVRVSFEYAEKVRTYYAPRPEEGALKRAIGYGLRWWAFMAVVLGISFWSVGSLIEYREAEEERQRRLQFQQVLFFGNDVVEDGILDAREAAENVEIPEEEEEEDPRFSMDKSERARRLYIIGYHYCLAGEYSMCEAAMRRVTTLVQDNRDAFRLQAWAGIQADDPRETSKMPEVSPVPSLEEFELELSLAGENLEEASEDDLWDDGARLQDVEFEQDEQSDDGDER